ncbi:outer membrane lipoprotein carrier protein LolA [Kitasatospora sp. NPDC056138]|uniref:LolA family protein n=1 Tax=Kitasatospora sp. NPDC056138 TaxID=3345724 RepID=UPI0035E0304D
MRATEGLDMVEQDFAYRPRRRTAVRALVPVGVIAVAATGIGLVPALASDSGPSLPSLTAEQLVAKALGSDTQSLSGTVQVSADLGVPAQLLGMADGALGGAAHGGGGRGEADPTAKLTELLGGEHTLQVAVDGPDRQRVGLIENLAGYELVRNGDQVWAWDSSSNQAMHLTAPKDAGRPGTAQHDPARHAEAPLTGAPTTPQEAAKLFLGQSAATTSVTVDGTATVAGQKAYQLSVKPKQSGSTIGEVRISVDADNGVPLAVLVKSVDGAKVLDVHFSSVSFAKPDAKTFDFKAPKGAKVTEHPAADAAGQHHPSGAAPQNGAKAGAKGGADGVNVVGAGWTSVLSAKLPSAPAPASDSASAHGGKHGRTAFPQDPVALAKSFGKPVKGGSLISTKVLNVLVTDDGRVFAGAVTLPVLQSAAGVK